MNILGLHLTDAENILQKMNRKYIIVRTSSPVPLKNTDAMMVVRVRDYNDVTELTVSGFKTHI